MISVCIPTFNGEKYIYKQIDSILKQLAWNDELIISDDSSTDDTLKIIKSFNDSRIKIFPNNIFHSPIYNLENALKHANGDYIFLSDQDDIWKNNKVSVIMNYVNNADLIIHDAELIDGNDNIIFNSFYKLNHTRKGKIYNLIKNGYIGCCMVFSRNILQKSLPFPQNLPMHDLWIGNIAAFKGKKVLFIQDKLISYRRHGNNVSNSSEKSNRTIKTRIADRLFILYNLLFRHY